MRCYISLKNTSGNYAATSFNWLNWHTISMNNLNFCRNEIVWKNYFSLRVDLFQLRLQRYIWEVSCCLVAHQWGKLSKTDLDKIILLLETTFVWKKFWFKLYSRTESTNHQYVKVISQLMDFPKLLKRIPTLPSPSRSASLIISSISSPLRSC